MLQLCSRKEAHEDDIDVFWNVLVQACNLQHSGRNMRQSSCTLLIIPVALFSWPTHGENNFNGDDAHFRRGCARCNAVNVVLYQKSIVMLAIFGGTTSIGYTASNDTCKKER